MKLYGSLNNRLEENHDCVDTIEVGTGMTEYLYTDRKAYEVISVADQKHIVVRLLDHKLNGEAMSNNWKLISNENNPTMNMVKRGKYWYCANTVTADILDDDNIDTRLWLAMNGFDRKVIKEKGKQTKYHKLNVSFGVADYYFDYEF